VEASEAARFSGLVGSLRPDTTVLIASRGDIKPFLRHEALAALEALGAEVSAGRGTLPMGCHVLLVRHGHISIAQRVNLFTCGDITCRCTQALTPVPPRPQVPKLRSYKAGSALAMIGRKGAPPGTIDCQLMAPTATAELRAQLHGSRCTALHAAAREGHTVRTMAADLPLERSCSAESASAQIESLVP
jgi:hypothetical protein